MRWRRGLLLVFGLAVIAFTIAWGFMPTPVLVDVVEVKRGPFRVTVEEEGKTRVIDRFMISAPVAGFARRIALDVGDPASPGQELLRLEPLRSTVLDPRSRAEAEARVAAAQANVKAAEEKAQAAEADAVYSEGELTRVGELYEEGVVARGEYDHARAEARRTQASRRSSEFAVDVARFELEAARTALRYSAAEIGGASQENVAITTPVEGRVLGILHESEGVVKEGEALMEIGDPRALEVEVEVLSADAVEIAPGTRVLFTRWGGEAPLEGRVRVVEPVGFTKVSALGVEEQRVLVIADIVSPRKDWERLGHGYRVEATFILWEGEDVLQIPTSALFRNGDRWIVFRVEGETAQSQAVEVGKSSGLTTEILSGFNAGDLVITHPDDSVEDGVLVSVRSED
jgi:HlyD family secretion protein